MLDANGTRWRGERRSVPAQRLRGRTAALLTGAISSLVLFVIGCSKSGTSTPLVNTARATEAGHSAEAPPSSSSQALSVQTVVPVRRDVVVKFEQSAPLIPFEEADLYAKVSGYVKAVHVDIGDTVEKDAPLLEIDVPDVVQDLAYKQALVRQAEADRDQAEADVKVAAAALITWQAQLEQAQSDVKKAESERQFRETRAKRYADLAAQEATTDDVAAEKRDEWEAAKAAHESAVARRKAVNAEKAALDAKREAAEAVFQSKARHVEVAQADVERTKITLRFATLRAPFAGVITRRALDPGTFVNAADSGHGEAIFTLARMDKVIAVLRVPEREAGAVAVGERAMMRISGLRNFEITGSVSRFAKSLEEKSRTMRVEIDIDNPSGAVYPGMYGPVTLVLNEIKGAITVPGSAVYAFGGQSYVIAVHGRQARRIPVKTGYDDGKIVQVVEGLKGDEEIVVSNKGQIEEGQALAPSRIDRSKKAGQSATAQIRS